MGGDPNGSPLVFLTSLIFFALALFATPMIEGYKPD